jgi:hypothetical protein
MQQLVPLFFGTDIENTKLTYAPNAAISCFDTDEFDHAGNVDHINMHLS